MSTNASSTGHKRKANNQPPSTSSSRKRQKFQDARTMSTQTADAALTRNGELNIANFIKAREFEIAALDKSMKKSRQNLSSRAFQQVPRHLRRRTASHNAKKVPRRLRGRAVREMIEDNTPSVNSKTRKPTSRLRLRLETAKALQKLTQKRKTVRQKKREAKENAGKSDPSSHKDVSRVPRLKKNKLANPPLATSKFKRRQVNKTWLPTHMWHTKRAHMTKSTEPLWRMAIPLRPTEKSYRATHRVSASRGCIAWDMSYISTLSCRGTETALEGMLKKSKFHGYGWSGQQYKKWKRGSRFASGWVCGGGDNDALGLVDIFWCAKASGSEDNTSQPLRSDVDTAMTDAAPGEKRRKSKLDYQIMIRVHPSAFHQFWLELVRNAKLQKPQVLIEDLRFEVGSISLMGPGSTEALVNTIKPTGGDGTFQTVWQGITHLSNPALLPLNPVLNFEVHDPRLASLLRTPTTSKDENSENTLHEMMVEWPLDAEPRPSTLFSNKARHAAGKLPSQWTLNRRRQKLLPGQMPQISASDPSIPIVLLARRPQATIGTNQGSWTLLAPWKCIDVIWRRLMLSPLSSGRKPRFGGLREQQQVAFEQSAAWFPGDYPGTEAGKAWERSQSETRFDEWIRRPPSRRLAWQNLDLGLNRRGEIGRGWVCDWEYLFRNSENKTIQHKSGSKATAKACTKESSSDEPLLTQRQRKAAKARTEADKETTRRRNTSSPESDEMVGSEQQFIQITPPAAKSRFQNSANSPSPSSPMLASVKITLLTKGTPNSAARIYRLPISRKEATQQLVVSSADAALTDTVPADNTPESAQRARPGLASKKVDSTSSDHDLDLRNRWLSLDPYQHLDQSSQKTKKEKINHRGLPVKAQHYQVESLRHINVLPKNPPQAIVEQYGAKPLSEDEKKKIREKELAVRMEEQKTWDVHVPCPDAQDLIGFVTSGGYNLAEGKGTAIGAIWVQRVLKGWTVEDQAQSFDAKAASKITSKQTAKIQSAVKQRRDRERHLCIVRNAGESVGRLAIWQLCE